MRGTARYIEHSLNYNSTLLIWDSSFEEFIHVILQYYVRDVGNLCNVKNCPSGCIPAVKLTRARVGVDYIFI